MGLDSFLAAQGSGCLPSLPAFLAVLLCLSAYPQGSSAQGCPESYGLQTYPDEEYCDKFHLCVNGTYSYETCANGLVYEPLGSVHNFCKYNWAKDCGKLIYDDTPISSPGCLYQYGIYPVGKGCQTTFFKCADGVAYETACQKGLAYEPSKHVCDYPDNIESCASQSESVVGFKCPSPNELPPNAVARRFLPFPRFPNPGDDTSYIVCVEGKPRINNCGDGSYFDHQTLTCYEFE
eukprot:TRINITY_DN821_c1_g1_i1.p1 TRINITY_DN821_c1_g1~~TRINITY_DN821_c1_g1_i1.p1  ORF type:complete len:235 (-),score=56.88 TRINITY_DN821_c1_g1_i1:233-937(-)